MAVFVQSNHGDFINGDDGVAGHRVSDFAAEREGSMPEFHGLYSYFYDVSLSGGTHKVDFRHRFRDHPRVVQLHNGV